MADLPGAVLFACTMNAVRSPMAAGLFRHLAKNSVYTRSAGVRPGKIDHFSIQVMSEIDIDISHHIPISINELQDTSFDYIITLTPEAHHQALEFTRTMAVEVEYWPTLDPSLATGSRDQILSSYRSCRDTLLTRIKKRFPV